MSEFALAALAELAETDPQDIVAAFATAPNAVAFSEAIGKTCDVYRANGLPHSMMLVGLAAACGFGIGEFTDSSKRGAGLAVERFTQAMMNVLKFSAENSFTTQGLRRDASDAPE
jgi:hypothetical protein